MTKLIAVTSIRSGAGKTTVAAILAEKLAEKYMVCLIDNNLSNINIYSASSSIESINLYTCLTDKERCGRAIKESAAELKNNLYFFSGCNELLTEEEINNLKQLDIFKYIVIDSGNEIISEVLDFDITVVNPNKSEYKMACERLSKSKEIKTNIIIINRYENSEFKFNKCEFKLYFCPEVINFTNGYELNLPEINEAEIIKLIEKITKEKLNVKVKPKFRLFGRS